MNENDEEKNLNTEENLDENVENVASAEENTEEEKKEVKKEESKKEVKKEEKKEEAKPKKEKSAPKQREGLVIGIIVALVVIIALSIFGYFIYNKNLKAVVTYDGGSVSVDDFEIYYRTFSPMLQYFYGYTNDDADAMGEIIAEKAASDMILVSRAKKAGITIDDEDKAIVDEMFADENEQQIFLDNGINPTRMKEFYYNDYIMDNYKEYLAEKLEDSVVEEYIKSNYGEDADMREYVTRHILFKLTDADGNELSEEDKAAKKAKADEVLAKALAGEDFETLAKENSEDTGTAVNGGEYTMYMDGTTDSDYSNAVITLNEGDVTSELVTTQFGYHIIKLEKYNENGRINNMDIRKAIVNEQLSKVTEECNVKIQTDVLKDVIAKITGKTSETDVYTQVSGAENESETKNSEETTENVEETTTENVEENSTETVEE